MAACTPSRRGSCLAVATTLAFLLPTWALAQPFEERATMRGHVGAVTSLAFSPDGKILASGGATIEPGVLDHSVRLWDARSRKGLHVLDLGANVNSLTVSPNGALLAACGGAAKLKLWNLRGEPKAKDLAGPRDSLRFVAFNSDGKMLAVAASKEEVDLLDVNTGEIVGVAEGDARNFTGAFSPDGKILAIGGNGNTVTLWDVPKAAPLATWRHVHKYAVRSLAFSPDGRVLATGAGNLVAKGRTADQRVVSDIYLWDWSTRRKLATLQGHAGQVNALAYFAKGAKLASASGDGTIRLWDVAAQKELAVLRGHTGPVLCLAISPDGKTLASGGRDKTVKLWNLE